MALADHGERETFGTWGSDGTDHWEMLDTGHHPSNPRAHEPIYVILASGGCQSPHFGGIADHVVDTPSGLNGHYSAEWHIHFVVDTTQNPPPEAPLPGMPVAFDNPTISKIDQEVAADDDLEIVETPNHFTCPVRPYQGDDC